MSGCTNLTNWERALRRPLCYSCQHPFSKLFDVEYSLFVFTYIAVSWLDDYGVRFPRMRQFSVEFFEGFLLESLNLLIHTKYLSKIIHAGLARYWDWHSVNYDNLWVLNFEHVLFEHDASGKRQVMKRKVNFIDISVI